MEGSIRYLYVQGTEFMIHLAELSGLSYYEVNWALFCVGMPLLTLGLCLNLWRQGRRLRRLRSRGKQAS